MTQDLYFFNSMSRKIEKTEPANGKEFKMYCCGPTVYNFAHIGNLRTYVFEDVLAKTIRLAGYNLTHVMNVTDVGHLTSDADEGQDKMLLAAEREHSGVLDIARKYEKVFFEHTAALGLNRPDIVARATENIQEMISFVQKLEEKGYAYFSNGNVYFDTSKFADYGKLSKQDRSDLKHGARIEQDTSKRNASDFVLWFTSSKFENQALQWDSPWGRGYPGWHIECSTMAMKFLGERVDIHCGGIDHIPVHHENEIAQSEAYLGHEWVKCWIHGEFLQLKNAKMSKSSGEFYTLDFLKDKGYEPMSYKYFCLTSHYRTQANFTFEALDSAKNSYESLKDKIKELKNKAKENTASDEANLQNAVSAFDSYLFNDLKTPQALALMWETLKTEDLPPLSKHKFLSHVDSGFGLDLQNLIEKEEETLIVPDDVRALFEERLQARANKDWKRSDELRDKIAAKGFGLKDLPGNKAEIFALK